MEQMFAVTNSYKKKEVKICGGKCALVSSQSTLHSSASSLLSMFHSVVHFYPLQLTCCDRSWFACHSTKHCWFDHTSGSVIEKKVHPKMLHPYKSQEHAHKEWIKSDLTCTRKQQCQCSLPAPYCTDNSCQPCWHATLRPCQRCPAIDIRWSLTMTETWDLEGGSSPVVQAAMIAGIDD